MRKQLPMLIALACMNSAAADEFPLGSVLEKFELAGYELIYTTSLVDEAAIVEWGGRIGLGELRRLLSVHSLTVERLQGRRLMITPLRSDADHTDETLDSSHTTLDTIVVTASRYEFETEGAGSHLITEADLEDNPSFAGDSLRVIHRLPGAASIGVTAKPNVRGGTDDELLVMFDGVELIEPFHLRDFQSMFSSFNPQAIGSVEFFSGGFPVRYGNRMSGVLDIGTKDVFDRMGGEFGLSAYSTSGVYFRETDHDRWLVSARRGNLETVLKSETGDPQYYDVYGNYARTFESGEFRLSAFVFDDDILFRNDESEVTSDIKNRYVWAQWNSDTGNRQRSTTVSLGKVDRLRKGATFSEEDTEGALFDQQQLDVLSFSHTQQIRLNESLLLDLGATYRDLSISYLTDVQVQKDTIAEFLGQPTSVASGFDDKFDGASASIFGSMKYQWSDTLILELGARFDHQDYAGSETQISPRFSVLYKPLEKLDLRFSYGRFHQPQAIYELRTADLETEFSEVQSSDHYIAALDYEFRNENRFHAEVFYKRMRDLKPRYVNLFDPYVYLPELQQDRIAITADEATARGLELIYSGSSDHVDWHVNYTYSEVQDRDSGFSIDRRWDQTHSVNAYLNWYVGNWTVGLAGTWHTGWATTALPTELPADQSLDIPFYRNNDRLKDFGSLDFKVAYEQPLPNSSLRYFLEITNLVSRANKGGVDYEIALEDDLYLLEEFDTQAVFPLVTNIGVVWRF